MKIKQTNYRKLLDANDGQKLAMLGRELLRMHAYQLQAATQDEEEHGIETSDPVIQNYMLKDLALAVLGVRDAFMDRNECEGNFIDEYSDFFDALVVENNDVEAYVNFVTGKADGYRMVDGHRLYLSEELKRQEETAEDCD